MARKPQQTEGGSLGSFLEDEPTGFVYTDVNRAEIRLRIMLTMAAYAYEYQNEEILSDADFDEFSRLVDLSIDTQRPDLDQFFREKFFPDTGMWIRSHPEIDKVAKLYHEHYAPDRSKPKRRKKK